MLDTSPHDSLAYPLAVGATKIGIDQKAFCNVLRENEINTFVINSKRFIAAFELDRLILKLMRQEAQREFLEQAKDIKQPRTEHHGTG